MRVLRTELFARLYQIQVAEILLKLGGRCPKAKQDRNLGKYKMNLSC